MYSFVCLIFPLKITLQTNDLPDNTTPRSVVPENSFLGLMNKRTKPSMVKTSTLDDEITRYLNTDPEDLKPEEVLSWWHNRRQTSTRFARMALDYLSVPGESQA